MSGEGFRVEASMGYQRPHFNKQTPKSVALLFPAYGTNHEPVLSDLIVAKQLPATAGSPKSFLNISWVWNIYFLFLIKMNLKEKAYIDCFIR